MTINPPFVARILSGFIKEELAKAGFKKAVLGLSGGLDSAVCAYLAARAVGPRNVRALLLPYGQSYGPDLEDAQDVVRRLGLRSETVDIAPMVDAYFDRHPTTSQVRRGNKMARERMSILYDVSAREKALILGTSNKTELILGYGTIHGDMACAINPLGDLYKTQVRKLAEHLGVPVRIRKKAPTAGLWPGQTDEGELGLTYAEADEILVKLVDERASAAEVIAAGYPRARVEKVAALVRGSEFKRHLPPIAKIAPRSVGHDFLYPYDRAK